MGYGHETLDDERRSVDILAAWELYGLVVGFLSIYSLISAFV